MILNDSFRVALMDRVAEVSARNEPTLEFMLSFWQGTLPTKAQFDTKFETKFNLFSDSNPGRVGQDQLYLWLRDELSNTELVGDDYGYETAFQVVSPNQAIYDPISITNPEFHQMEVFAEGTAQFFVATVYNGEQGSKSNRYTQTNVEVYHMIMGTLGLPGSGADLEIADTNITFASTVQPGIIEFNF